MLEHANAVCLPCSSKELKVLDCRTFQPILLHSEDFFTRYEDCSGSTTGVDGQGGCRGCACSGMPMTRPYELLLQVSVILLRLLYT